MKKPILLFQITLLLAAALTVVILPSSFVKAGETCGAPNAGCPSTCLSAGAACSAKQESIPAPNVPGKQLTCIKQQNVGCGFFLDFPPIKANACPEDFEHDDSIDGATDCGFLGLSAIFGDSKQICHKNIEVQCKTSAKCPPGTKTRPVNEKSCFVSTGGATTQTRQCCYLNPPDRRTQPQLPEDELTIEEVIDERDQFANSIVINERDQIASNGQELQFTIRAINRLGQDVTNTTIVNWSLSGDYADSEINPQNGVLITCSQCRGTFQVRANQVEGYEKYDSTSVTVINIRNFRIEPQSLRAEAGARVFLYSKAIDAITSSPVDVAATWGTQGPASVVSPNPGTSQNYAVILVNAGEKADVLAQVGRLNSKSEITILQPDASRTVNELIAYPETAELTVGRQLAISTLASSAEGIALAVANLRFTSNNPRVATVNRQGVVTAVAPGDVKITITAQAATKEVSIHVIECRDGSTDTAFCTARHNFDIGGPYERTCTAGKWDNQCKKQTCSEGSKFRCVVNGKVGFLSCNAETGNFAPPCTPLEAGTLNAQITENELSGAICASLTQPSNELLAQLVTNPASGIGTCKLLGLYSNDASCTTRRSAVLTFTYGAQGSSFNSFTVGEWNYAITSAAFGENPMVSFTLTNVNTQEAIPGSFMQTGSRLPELTAQVELREVNVETLEDESVQANATLNVQYNQCKYSADFTQVEQA